MLEILFKAETPKDNINPINVANALIETDRFNPAQLEEIAEHLMAYTKRIRLERRKVAGVDI